MKWYEIIGLIGSVVSIIAALFTVRYSSIVKRAKTEILSLLKVVKFSSVNELTVSVLSQVKKIAHKQTIPRGTNLDDTIDSLNAYYEKIFKLKTEVEVNQNSTLNTLVETFRTKVISISNTPVANHLVLIGFFNELYEITLNINQEFDKLTKKIVEN